MSQAMTVLSYIFWGALLLTFITVIHEGGHFLVARAFGVRVTEFFLGFPCKAKLSWRSRRHGTEFGITPILMGGYNRICGMEDSDDELMPAALALLTERGRITVDEAAGELGCDAERAQKIFASLLDMASAVPFYVPEKGEKPSSRYYPSTYLAPRRDAAGLTVYDSGHDFEAPGATEEGVARGVEDPRAFFDSECRHTYIGLSPLKRVLLLIAGIVVNVVVGLLIISAVLMISGVTVASSANTLGDVMSGSLAESSGLEAGDTIVSIDGVATPTWSDVAAQIKVALSKDSFDIVYERDGAQGVAHVDVAGAGGATALGVYATGVRYHLTFAEALKTSVNYVVLVATAVAQLLVPTQAVEVLDNSTSVVGITVMAGQAATAGADQFLFLAGGISLSLGLMNLLPIPPLDGGKIVIEIVQGIRRRRISEKVRLGISYAGIAFVMCIFIYTLRGDLLRIFLG